MLERSPFAVEEKDPLGLQTFYTVTIEAWMQLDEDLLLQALSLTDRIHDLVIPFCIMNAEKYFSLYPNLYHLQTPTRVFRREERTPERVVARIENV